MLNNKDFKTDRKSMGYERGIIFIPFFIIFFTYHLFENIAISGMWVYGAISFTISGLILSLIVKGIIDSSIWKKKQQIAKSKI